MSKIFNLRPLKFSPNWDFWFENKPSGNRGQRGEEEKFWGKF
jgi:hypothetical protein